MIKNSCTYFLITWIFTILSAPVLSQHQISVLPTPVSVTTQPGAFILKNGLKIRVADKSLLPAATYLQEILRNVAKTSVSVGKEKEADVYLTLGYPVKQENAYQLIVSATGVKATAADYSGLISAISTFRQLCPDVIEREDSRHQTYSVPAVDITDAPRFTWRGSMLDASRHFWNKEEVKKYLDLMALYKLNKFHWHLTDDQGWRIEIKQYPLLTEKGAWRKLDSNDKYCLSVAKAQDNPDMLIPKDRFKVVDGDTLYGGYYTQEDIKEVIVYASQRGIDIIPEIDMPGHFLAAIGQYPELACDGMIGWGSVFSSPICPGKDSTLEFCKNVYKEVFALFPYKYVHLGGDEVEKGNWEKCALCQKRIQEENLGSIEKLQAWFVREMESFFKANGKKFIGWDEVVEDGLSSDVTITWWRSWARNSVPKAISQDMHVIFCPNSHLYFDYDQQKGATLQKVLQFEPFDPQLDGTQQKNALGIQANLWAEMIPTWKRVEYMVMPRLIAMSEVAWVEPSVKQDFATFQKLLIPHFKRMDQMGINYCIPSLQNFYDRNSFVNEAVVKLENPLPEVGIRYTTDGTIPTFASPLFNGSLKVNETTSFMLRTFRPDGTAGDIVKTTFIKEAYREPEVLSSNVVLEDGLNATWFDFRGKSCADIDKSALKGTYQVEEVSIPKEVKGNIGLVLKGYLNVPTDGIYTFALLSDDGSILKLGDEVVINNDGAHSPVEKRGQMALKKGLHPLEVRYFDSNGGELKLQLIDEQGVRKNLEKEWFKR